MSCGCFCSACAGCNVPRNGDSRLTAPLLGHTTETPASGSDDGMAADLIMMWICWFLVRGLCILLGTYLFDSMKRYAVNYVGGDTWFSTFAVIVVAVPVVEMFCIYVQVVDQFTLDVIDSE